MEPSALSLPKALKNIAREVPSWSHIKEEDVNVIRSIGASNHTFIIQRKDKETQPSAVIFRLFGKVSGEYFIDRDFENFIYPILSQFSLGPSIYHCHNVFRIEEYFDAKVLPFKQMLEPFELFQVIRSVALLHSIKVDKYQHLEPKILRLIDNKEIWRILRANLAEAKTDPNREFDWDIFEDWIGEAGIQRIRKITDQLPKKFVLSHNDMNSNNILICNKNRHYKLIDLEYSDFSWRGIDLANYILETHFDYCVNEPPFFIMKNPGVQLEKVNFMVSFYLICSKLTSDQSTYWKSSKEVLLRLKDGNFDTEIVKAICDDFGIKEEEKEELKNEILLCMFLNNYFWLLWGVFIGDDKTKNFDYILHAWKRVEFLEFLLKEKEAIFVN